MSNKPSRSDPKAKPAKASAGGEKTRNPANQGLAGRSVTEHHVPGADGPTGAEAEQDNNP